MINEVISNSSGKPICRRLFEQISAEIINGSLKPKENLPPIRTVVKELRVSVIIVKKAGEELERNVFIYSIIGRGCFVADLNSNDLTMKRDDIVIERLVKDIKYYRETGITLKEIIKTVREVY